MILVLCMPVVVSQCAVGFAVAYLLIAIILGCMTILRAPMKLHVVALVLLAAACTFAPGMFAITPLAAYICMCQRPWVVRFVWAVPFCAALFTGDWRICVAVAVLCAIACILAVRAVRNEAERRGMRAVRDSLREQALELVDDNVLLREELATVNADAGYEAAPEFNASAFADLTEREQAVVGLIAEGYDNREIAGSLYLSEGTVRNHISSILQKKHLKNRTQIAIMYYRG